MEETEVMSTNETETMSEDIFESNTEARSGEAESDLADQTEGEIMAPRRAKGPSTSSAFSHKARDYKG